jgi:hypothetical protein
MLDLPLSVEDNLSYIKFNSCKDIVPLWDLWSCLGWREQLHSGIPWARAHFIFASVASLASDYLESLGVGMQGQGEPAAEASWSLGSRRR